MAVDAFIEGLSIAVSWPVIGFMALGLLLGIVLGALPGIGSPVGMAIVLPLTLPLDATPAIICSSRSTAERCSAARSPQS